MCTTVKAYSRRGERHSYMTYFLFFFSQRGRGRKIRKIACSSLVVSMCFEANITTIMKMGLIFLLLLELGEKKNACKKLKSCHVQLDFILSCLQSLTIYVEMQENSKYFAFPALTNSDFGFPIAQIFGDMSCMFCLFDLSNLHWDKIKNTWFKTFLFLYSFIQMQCLFHQQHEERQLATFFFYYELLKIQLSFHEHVLHC